MSYMGPRYMGGGGQIFPHSQANQAGFQPQQFQQHLQVMQMQAQLQQKLQLQKQQHLSKNADPAKDKGKNEPSLGQNHQNSRQNQAIDNSKNQNQTKPMGPNQSSNQRHSGPNKPPVSAEKNTNQNSKPTNPPSSGPLGAMKPENRNAGGGPNQNADNKDKQDSSRSQPSNDNKSSNGRFGNKPQGQSGPAKGQQGSTGSGPGSRQGSLMGQPPPLMPNPPKESAIKSEPNPSPAKGAHQGGGHHGQSGGGHNDNYDNSNAHFNRQRPNSYDNAGGQNQSHTNNSSNYNYRNNYGNTNAGPNDYQKNLSNPSQQENSYKGNRSSQGGGRNMPMSNSSSDYKPNMSNRIGSGSGGPNSFSRGSKSGGGGYYGSDRLKEKVEQMLSGPQLDLPEIDITEKKFNAYAKLFIGNLPKNSEQDELLAMFEKFGEIGPVYINKDSSFAFINFDFKASAAKAMREVDGKPFKNRFLKVRFATINEGIRVKNLSNYVSNELLEKTFSIFGLIESCRVIVDDRGNPKGEGIVIYRDKKSALLAIKKCSEECYFLSGAMRPVIVTPLEPVEDNVEGLPETVIPKNEEYRSEREIGPHFADNDSFEFEFGMQWKQLFNMYEEKKSILNRDFQIELERLEKKMVLAKVEYETDKLRKELAQREAESAQLRRHFDGEAGGASGGQYAAMTSSNASGYDSYNAGKRSLDQGYDPTFNRPYDSQYNDGYNRGGYSGGDYDRSAYDQGYGSYNREEYRRGEGGYGHEEPYDRPPYDHPKDIPPERPPTFDQTSEPGYKTTPAEVPPPIAEPYKAPSKRPRY